MSIDTVKAFFKQHGLEDRVMQFAESSATVELAAQAVGCEPARIAKTMSFFISEKPILVVTAGDAKIDNKKYKNQFHEKAKMIPWDQVEENIGHAPGGVCPFAVEKSLEVYLDVSLKRFDTVFPAAGSSSSAVKLSIPELENCSGFEKWVDVCKCWQADE